MELKDLLVQVDDAKPCGVRLELAVRLARDFDAHLVGLHVAPRHDIPAYIEAEIPAEARAVRARAAAETRASAEALFREHARRAGVDAEWRHAEGDPADLVRLHARYADLAIVGQAHREDPVAAPLATIPEEVVLGAGRPVLVVPFAGRFSGGFERVLVAWNATREAARAVSDALPILGRAQRVAVLAVNPHVGPEAHGELPGADVALHLARHGVRVEASSMEAHDIEVGDLLLSRAADLSADLIVMGAYGRSRLRELVLGGVTRQLLEQMTVPVFMSH